MPLKGFEKSFMSWTTERLVDGGSGSRLKAGTPQVPDQPGPEHPDRPVPHRERGHHFSV